MILEKLKTIRNDNNLRQKDIAEVLNISLGTYAMNETGHDTITLLNLIKFCDYFNVSIDYVFNLNNIKNYSNTKLEFDKETLKTRLKEFRSENKLTQVQLGKFLDIDHSVWCRYESGITTIPTTFLYEICSKYNISADYLLGKTDSPKYLK